MNHKSMCYSIAVCLMAVVIVASDSRLPNGNACNGYTHALHSRQLTHPHNQHQHHHRHQQHQTTTKLHSLFAHTPAITNTNQKFSFVQRTIFTDDKQCMYACKNGGKCVRGKCSCPLGFTGQMCGLDVNECQDKPCDQSCHNTLGSYYCTCRTGFQLQPDRQSCKKLKLAFGNRNDEDEAFEARDLENEVNQAALADRISVLERITEAGRVFDDGMAKKTAFMATALQRLHQRLDDVEKRLHELSHIQGRMDSQDVQLRKMDYIINMLYKCRTKHQIFCSMSL